MSLHLKFFSLICYYILHKYERINCIDCCIELICGCYFAENNLMWWVGRCSWCLWFGWVWFCVDRSEPNETPERDFNWTMERLDQAKPLWIMRFNRHECKHAKIVMRDKDHSKHRGECEFFFSSQLLISHSSVFFYYSGLQLLRANSVFRRINHSLDEFIDLMIMFSHRILQ